MVKLAVALCVLAGCFDDHYECDNDQDCDVGTGGRCEVDHHCTLLDGDCATGRRYTAHSGASSGVCYEGTVELANLCAPGQPPATATGCAATVCDALPSCCSLGWTEACVVHAQVACPAACDTRIAITATRGARVELWDLRWNGAWSATQRTDLDTLLAWLAPAPGTSEPRLVGLRAGTLVVDDGHELILDPARTYVDINSVDFDRDTRDTLALASQASGGNATAIVKLDGSTPRVIGTGSVLRQTWGDFNHDAYPDVVAAVATGYNYLANSENSSLERTLSGGTSSTFVNGSTPSTPPIRSFSWDDVNGDGLLDVAVFGDSLNVHRSGTQQINDRPAVVLDCAPLVVNGDSTCGPLTTLAGALRWTGTKAQVIGATVPQRKLYTIDVGATMSTISTFADPCPTCGPILAVVTRDLNADGVIDVVAIDAALHLFVAMSSGGTLGPLTETTPIKTTTTNFTIVRTSVSGK